MTFKLIINTDGGARGNPGPAGIGVVIRDGQNNIVGQYQQYIGEATNNCAEYKALILALKEAAKLSNSQSPISNLQIRMDSELIVRQMQGKYKIKDPNLKILAAEVFKLSRNFQSLEFKHVPREQNKEADRLVNQAIDEALYPQIRL
ncbi:MAG: ribonuclease HI family protein [Patescibacteria group bacterium]|nr:ribonuclease HI family protein [Patescibacteria group bacterium]